MSETPAPLCTAEQITVKYGKITACDAVTFGVEPGAVYALLGRNGAGKSSLVRCLLGQQKPKAGHATLFGKNAWKTRAKAMERTGVVPERPDAPPAMTAPQLAKFCSKLYRNWDHAGVAQRLERYAIPPKVPFGKLSRGQAQEVMLALALGHHPDLLILDDPTLGLDAVARKGLVEELIGELADRDTTVLLTTHDLAGFEGIATHVGILQVGQLVVNEDLEGLKGRFRRLRYRVVGECVDADPVGFDCGPVRVVGQDVEAVVTDFDEERFAAFGGEERIEDLEQESMSLEEIFIAVGGGERD